MTGPPIGNLTPKQEFTLYAVVVGIALFLLLIVVLAVYSIFRLAKKIIEPRILATPNAKEDVEASE